MTKPPPRADGSRHLSVKHTTHFSYNQPIPHSKHCVHLRPIDDAYQSVADYRLQIFPAVPVIESEDVFGNWASRFEICQPYTELTVTAESTTALSDVDPFAFTRVPIRPSFPLVWMPWEHVMLLPYLTPLELPETQLRELYDYAMSFVERNNHDLMETLFAINLALFREYQYVPGSTGLETTPYEVLTNRKGVCQDFANLFICMARLLGIPALCLRLRLQRQHGRRPHGRTPRMPGCSSTFPRWDGKDSTPPTECWKTPITCAWLTAGITAMLHPPREHSTPPPRKPWPLTSRSWIRQ